MAQYQFIPWSVRREEQKQNDSERWAAKQRVQLADDWAANQRKNLEAMGQQIRQWQASQPKPTRGQRIATIQGQTMRPETGEAPDPLKVLGAPQQALYGAVEPLPEGTDRLQNIASRATAVRPSDTPQLQGTDLLGKFGAEPGLGRDVAGFGLDLVADPLNLVGAPIFGKGAKAVGKAAAPVARELAVSQTGAVGKGVRNLDVLRAEASKLEDAIAKAETEIAYRHTGTEIIKPKNMFVGWTDNEIMEFAQQEGRNPYTPDWYDSLDSKAMKDAHRVHKGGKKVTETSPLREEVKRLTAERKALEPELEQARMVGEYPGGTTQEGLFAASEVRPQFPTQAKVGGAASEADLLGKPQFGSAADEAAYTREAERAAGQTDMFGAPPSKPPTTTGGPSALEPAKAESWLATVKPTGDILGQAYNPDWTRKLVDKYDNPVTRNVAQAIGVPKRGWDTEGLVLRESILADGKSAVTGAMARLRQLGSSKDVFKGTEGLAVHDILTYPDRYPLNPQQKAWSDNISKLSADMHDLLISEGVPIEELTFEEGGRWIGRKVMGKVGADGEIELATIGRGRTGGKAGFQKHRTYETAQEAEDAGFKYLEPEETLQANLVAAYRKIADQRQADYVLSKIPYRTASAPEELKLARDYAAQKLMAVRKLKQVINRGYRGERVPENTVSSIGRHFPDQAKGLVKAGISKDENPIIRARLQAVEATIPTIEAEAKMVSAKARSALARANERARTTRYGERVVMSPAYQGKFFNEKDAEKLTKMLDLEKGGRIRGTAQAVSWVNALPRLLMTTFDLGPAFIQGQLALFSHPKVWGKTMGTSMKAAFSGQGYQQFLATHADTIKKWSQNGAIFTPSEFTETTRERGALQKIPVLREIAKPFARAFESYLNAMKIYGLEGMEHMAKTPEDARGLAQFWNEMAGVTDTARMGVGPTQREVETAVLFAPRYTRAVLTLMSDIAKGGLRGHAAREAVSRTIMGGLTGYMAAWTIAHQIDPKGNPSPHLDPREGGKFLTIKIGNQNIGMGGTFYGASRTLLQMAMDPGKAHEYAYKFVSSKMSPMVGQVRGYIEFPWAYNTPFKFTKEVIGGNLLPIWVQGQVLDSVGIEGMVGEFAGLRSFPERDTQRGLFSPPKFTPSGFSAPKFKPAH